MNVPYLLIALGVETGEFLTGRGAEGFLKVRVQAAPTLGCFVSDAVARIEALGAVGSFEFLVELRQYRGEAVRDAVLVVEGDGALDGFVADGVAVSEVFRNDA